MPETSTNPGVLVPDPKTVVLGLCARSWINWMFMGTLIVQIYHYQNNFSEDRRLIRALVYLVVVLDIAQTIIMSHFPWYIAVVNWDKPDSLLGPDWSGVLLVAFAGLVSGIVQLFYCWRIWVLSGNKWMRRLALIIAFFEFHISQEEILKYHPQFTFWLSGSFVADTLITGSMIYVVSTDDATVAVRPNPLQLRSARAQSPNSHMDGIMKRLINSSIQTGLLTMIGAGVDLALFVTITTANFHYVPAFVLGKLYSNSLLATLNARRGGSHMAVTDSALLSRESYSMRLQVSRVTERISDGEMLGGTTWTSGKVDLANNTTDVEQGTTDIKVSRAI
ncbi:hypothetical protein CPC08DRAFT_756398 [Agrocybe pediades]|nr:hypothetical protein CPC08DRAFT_756398 [Agrocybe pediades]